MKNYRHLNRDERYQIQAFSQIGTAVQIVAEKLGRHVDTIKRELSKGKDVAGVYCAERAEKLAHERKRNSRNARRIDERSWSHVETYLAQGLSPQQVAGRLKAEGVAQVSHESIYLRIYASAKLPAQLRCQHKKRRKRATAKHKNRCGAIRDRVGIEERPAIVEEKSRIGDWEGDTVAGRQGTGSLVTMVDRLSRYTLVQQVPQRRADLVAQAIVSMFTPHKERCHSITLDNGSEFAGHVAFSQALQASVYFANPHHPWERGLNENTNGLLRQYFPKGCSLRNVTDKQVQDAANRLNHRPRKCLSWRTPHEVFFNLPMTRLTL